MNGSDTFQSMLRHSSPILQDLVTFPVINWSQALRRRAANQWNEIEL